uniref:5-hydroxytryptamine receptor 3D n=1 Tax=Theropithecus gelada TaxID=9565 RepID=A0A8D2K7E9_THEGE
MERGWFHGKGFLLGFILHLLLQGKGNTLIINCSGFGQHGVDPPPRPAPAAFQAVFDRKAVGPVTNCSIPIHVNITFTLSLLFQDSRLQLVTSFLHRAWPGHNQFVQWNPDECRGIKKSGMATENLWLSDVFIEQSISVDQTPAGLMPMGVVSICKLDTFYFPFHEQSCMLSFNSFTYTGYFQIHHRTSFRAGRECVLLGIYQRAIKVTMATNRYEQAIFYVVIRCRHRPSPYVVNFLVPSAILVAIDILSFYLPLESRNYAPLKMTVLLGYSVFLLMMNDLLPATGTSSHASSPAGTIFITHLLHVATTHPPPLPRWLHSLLLHCTSPGRCCPTAPQKGNKGLGLTPTHLPGEGTGQMPGPEEAELTGGSEWTRAQWEREAQKQHSVELWVQFSHVMDALLFRLYLLFMASSILTVICLWNT